MNHLILKVEAHNRRVWRLEFVAISTQDMSQLLERTPASCSMVDVIGIGDIRDMCHFVSLLYACWSFQLNCGASAC